MTTPPDSAESKVAWLRLLTHIEYVSNSREVMAQALADAAEAEHYELRYVGPGSEHD